MVIMLPWLGSNYSKNLGHLTRKQGIQLPGFDLGEDGPREGARLFDPSEQASVKSLSRLRLLIAYDGSEFHGFADQPGIRTVAGELKKAIRQIYGTEIDLVCAGRTDRGVHAQGQVVHFDLPAELISRTRSSELVRFAKSLNSLLNPEIAIREISIVGNDFDARHSAKSRKYLYTIVNSDIRSPFIYRYAWYVEKPLDMRAMVLGCDALIGEHDFSSFCRRPPGTGSEEPLVRRIIDARWHQVSQALSLSPVGAAPFSPVGAVPLSPVGAAPFSPVGATPWFASQANVMQFEIVAVAFCHQMVRSIVGTLVAMGMGKRKPGEMASILRARDRSVAEPPAPPNGLSLVEVVY